MQIRLLIVVQTLQVHVKVVGTLFGYYATDKVEFVRDEMVHFLILVNAEGLGEPMLR